MLQGWLSGYCKRAVQTGKGVTGCGQAKVGKFALQVRKGKETELLRTNTSNMSQSRKLSNKTN
jgi:hypothetical protein